MKTHDALSMCDRSRRKDTDASATEAIRLLTSAAARCHASFASGALSAVSCALLLVLSGAGTARGQGVVIGSYSFDTGTVNYNQQDGMPASGSCGGVGNLYTYVANTSCVKFSGREVRWVYTYNDAKQWQGRGRLKTDVSKAGTHGYTTVVYVFRTAGGSDADGEGLTRNGYNQCSYSCDANPSLNIINKDVDNPSGLGGMRCNNLDAGASSTCAGCGTARWESVRARFYGARWHYINDWACFGGFGTGNPGAISDLGTIGGSGSFPFGENNIYVWPYIDTSHGNYFANNLYGGKTPVRVQTGDCNRANIIDFKGNASAAGNCDYCNSYAFAWVYSPGGAGPRFAMGSDDGNRVWVNGSLINDNNAFRGVTRDQDVTGGISLSAGWNRVLFKVHNGGGGFGGTMSLRNGGDTSLNEPSVNVFDYGSYYSYGVGYEQDDWYPRTTVSSFYGTSSPADASSFYGNNTTVAASGTASVTGPVPYWRTMQYRWGNGLGGVDSNYADVSGTPTGTSWSHSETGVTGHRRFHFFSVSRSGRTSGQRSGTSGGWTWGSPGARYYDVYVDNVAPNNPSFSSVSPASTTSMSLGWSIPTDKGVGVADGSTETSGNAGAAEAQNWYRRGDVGVQVYRGGSTVVSAWGTGTSATDTGLSANTQYTYTLEARDNTGQSRGAWANTTGQQGSTAKYTLQNAATTPTFGAVTTTTIPLTTTGPVNLSAGSSGVIFKRNATTDLTKVSALNTTDTGLSANTQYSYTARCVNGDNVATAESASASAWTLSVPPTAGSVTADNAAVCADETVTWTAVGGFGAGKIAKYKYAFTQSDTHSWSGSETDWSTGTIQTTPTAGGTWYLHVKGYNGANVENGTRAYAVTAHARPTSPSPTYTRGKGLTAKIRISTLGSGDPIDVLGTPANGGSVSKDATFIYYVPPSPDVATDNFAYRMQNANNCTNSGTITFHTTNHVASLYITTATTSEITLSFYGIPTYQYMIQRSCDLSTWVDVESKTAAANGLVTFTETPPCNPCYYRTRQQ